MTLWEYSVLVMGENDDDGDALEAELNGAGREGWEVAGIMPNMGAANSDIFILLKRPLAQP